MMRDMETQSKQTCGLSLIIAATLLSRADDEGLEECSRYNTFSYNTIGYLRQQIVPFYDPKIRSRCATMTTTTQTTKKI